MEKTIISGDKLKQLIFGAIDYIDFADGFIPLRFSKNYSEYIDDFVSFAGSSAGIHFIFETDAREIEFDFEITQICDDHILPAFDVYINEVLKGHFTVSGNHEQLNSLKFSLSQSGKVDVWLPINATVKVLSLNLINSSFFNSFTGYDKQFLFIGDSIVQGFNCEYPSLTISSSLSRIFDVEVINQGIGGYSYRESFVQDFGIYPDLIIVSLGTNDITYEEQIFRDPEGFYKKLFAIYGDVPLVCITPFTRFLAYDKQKMESITELINNCVYGRKNCLLIDGVSVSPCLEEFYDDGLHPNLSGMQYTAFQIYKAIKQNGDKNGVTFV